MAADSAVGALQRVRAACTALPEVTERLSHGTPTWFVRDRRSFAMFWDDHHGDGRLCLWLAAPPDVRATLVEANPQAYFVPPYVGHRGWVGVRLDRDLPWSAVEYAIADAHRVVEAVTPRPGPARGSPP